MNSKSLELNHWFGDCPFAIVAMSGGVDSSLVAFLARRYLGSDRVLAVIADSPSLKRAELRDAQRFSETHDIPLRVINTREMDVPEYRENPPNRCYFCKHTLYEELQRIAADSPASWILNGTNVDDLGDYRPGLRAASEHQVRSPLAECAISKLQVRELAALYGLACHDKPASPCLSSRIAYGQAVTVEKLRQIEAAENFLLEMGFPVCRVRHISDTARIEVPTQDVSKLLDHLDVVRAALLELDFQRVEIDQEGFVSGKLNRTIPTHEGY